MVVGANCRMVPEVPGTHEDSKLYIDLQDLIKNRPLTNLIYASYVQPGVAAQMDRESYQRNKQNQHRAEDVYRFFDVGSIKNLLDAKVQSTSFGFTDASGALVDFTAQEAYSKAQDFNNTNKGRVAYVAQHGDKFNILLEDRDSRTIGKVAEINRNLVEWNVLSEQLTSMGVSVDDLIAANPQLVNPGNVRDFVRNLSLYSNIANDTFSVKDIEILLTLNNQVPIVRNLLSRGWGNVSETTQRMYDILHNSAGTSGNEILVNRVLEITKKLPQVSRAKIIASLNNAVDSFNLTDEATNIQKTLEDLDNKYHLEQDVFVRKNEIISKISDAFADAIMSLQRQIRNIENRSGKTTKSRELTELQSKLIKQLNEKQNASSLMEFVTGALTYAQQINDILNKLSNTGTNLEFAHNVADVLSKATSFSDAYYNIVDALSDMNSLINDFSMSDVDKDALQSAAKQVKEILDNQRHKIVDLRQEAMLSIGKNFLGEHNALYGKDVIDIINMAEADTSIMDYLYSVGRSSNAVISMLGALVRDAQSERDSRLQYFAREIRRATHILTKDGKDSSFIYDEKGRIKSEYDWDAYFKAKNEYSANLQRAGFKRGTDEYSAEMDLWEDRNTVEVEVDHENHRFEKMPKFYLKTNFRQGWSKAQNEYYDRMMELKGQIGTLLPAYAQHQYIAPQKRTSWDQVLKEGIEGKRDFSNVAKWFWEDAKKWKLRPDDTRFRKNGLYIDGSESLASTSNYDNTILRQIPIFYIKKLDVNDLSHDFSSALQSLASTALNYDAMDGIKNIAEMITDYASSQTPVELDKFGRPEIDFVNRNMGIGVATTLRKTAQGNNTASMLDSFVLKHIYGVENINAENTWSVICSNLIGYTSLKGLAVNVKGALTNKYVGVIQTIIRAIGGQYFGVKDLLQAEAILLGSDGGTTTGALIGGVLGGNVGAAIGAAAGTAVGAVGMTGKFMDILSNNRNSKDTLISDFFDSSQDIYSDLSDQRYHHTMFGRLFGSFNPMSMYQRGEHWIHMLNVYATLLHEKVVQYDKDSNTYKTISLYDALEKGDKIDGNTELKLKEGIFKIDGAKIDDLSNEYFSELKRRIRYINQQCHGSMNKEDKGLIHQWMLGKMTMNFRQWMVEHYSSRFRGLHWDESIRDVNLSNFYNNTEVYLGSRKVKLIDALERIQDDTDGNFHYRIKDKATTKDGQTLTDELLNRMLENYAEDSGWRRGFKADVAALIKEFLKERREYGIKANMYWDKLSETQKADVKQVLGESLMILALTGLSACMGDPDRHRGEFYFRLWMYVVKRCLFDELATTPLGVLIEGKTIINNPIASSQTVVGLLYPVLAPLYSPKDIFSTVQSGRYKGWNRYLRNVVKYTVPFYSQIDQLLNISEDSSVYQVFENQITR